MNFNGRKILEIEFIQKYCKTFPGVSEEVQWENCLLIKVCGKIFVLFNFHPSPQFRIALKTTPEKFCELTEIDGVSQAPNFAKNHWIGIKDKNGLKISELKNLINESYQLVFEKLPKKIRESIVKK